MAAGARDSLQIDQHEAFQRRQLLVARIAVACFAVIIVLGLLGVFGSGPLSHATVRSDDGALTVDYQRFVRFKERTDVEIALRGGDGAAQVMVDRAFLDGFEVGGVLPEPDRESERGGQLVFTYADQAPETIRISMSPRTVGIRRGRVSVDGGGAVSFRQLVYP